MKKTTRTANMKGHMVTFDDQKIMCKYVRKNV